MAGASHAPFVVAANFNDLTVNHCTITGTMFGIKATAGCWGGGRGWGTSCC